MTFDMSKWHLVGGERLTPVERSRPKKQGPSGPNYCSLMEIAEPPPMTNPDPTCMVCGFYECECSTETITSSLFE